MLEKQETASSSDDADHGQQPALDSIFTSSVDNLLYEKSTYSEGHIDILNSANKAEENPYDILPPKYALVILGFCRFGFKLLV